MLKKDGALGRGLRPRSKQPGEDYSGLLDAGRFRGSFTRRGRVVFVARLIGKDVMGIL